MRRRTTAEMDELVRVAGFEKIDMEIDQWGMFTVSIARRRSLTIRARLSLKAFTVSAELSVLFLIVYGGCNWITARRA